MLTLQNVAVAIAVLLLLWYLAGSWVNRARARQLIDRIREAVPGVGAKPTIRWFGRSAFQVEVSEPALPLTGFRLLCLLEPREFPLAQLWARLRGRRDQVMVQTDSMRPPRASATQDPAGFGIAGLTAVILRPSPPHIQLTLQVSPSTDGSIPKAMELAQQLAGGRSGGRARVDA